MFCKDTQNIRDRKENGAFFHSWLHGRGSNDAWMIHQRHGGRENSVPPCLCGDYGEMLLDQVDTALEETVEGLSLEHAVL